MNRNILMMTVMTGALIMSAACSGKKGGETADKTAEDKTEMAQGTPKAFPWDFPEGIALENPEVGQYVLSPYTFYPNEIIESNNPEEETYIFYSTRLNKYEETHSIVGEAEMPNSLIILLPKGKKAKVGDVLLTWWQSGSGMKRAIVTDASDPEAPKVDYLDLDYSDDPDKPSMANKYSNEQLKVSSFDVIEDGKWQPGATIAAFDENKWKECILIHATDDKVLALGFAGTIYAFERSACKLISLHQDIKVGDNVMAVWVGSFREGYRVTKIDRKIGRVWVERDGKKEIVNILQVVKSL